MSERTPPMLADATERAELQSRVERQIILGTWGRIHNLTVDLSNDGLHIAAQTPSYYIKQLVQHAVYEVLGTETTLQIDFDIRVGKTAQVLPGNNDLWGVPRSGPS